MLNFLADNECSFDNLLNLLAEMSDNASNASWGLLPAELLEKIFESVPRLMLGNVGKVCTLWRDVVHRLAVKHLTNQIQNQLIEENQLERWGWCSAATVLDHNILACSCIHLAFNFFSQKDKTFLGQGFAKQSFDRPGKGIPVGIMADKLFFATANEEKQVCLKVINRLKPECEPRLLETPAEQRNASLECGLDVQMVSCENLLVVLVYEGGQVSLWNGKEETWLSDLDLSVHIPYDHFNILEVAVSKNLLAVSANVNSMEFRTHFFRVNTSQPAAFPPQFLGAVTIPKFGLVNVHLNERWVGMRRLEDRELLVIKKAELFTEDQSQVADMAKVVDSQRAGSLWHEVRYVRNASYVNLQPGNSSHLAVEFEAFDFTKLPITSCFGFSIISLDTGEILCQISNSVDLLPASWWGGGAFLFLKKLQPGVSKDDVVKLQVVTYDFSQKMGVCTAEELEQEATRLVPGPVFEFSGVPKLYFHRFKDPKMHVDYSGVVVFAWPDLFVAAID